jgi:hypothetical protein
MQVSPQWQSSPQQPLRLIVDRGASMALLILLLLDNGTVPLMTIVLLPVLLCSPID